MVEAEGSGYLFVDSSKFPTLLVSSCDNFFFQIDPLNCDCGISWLVAHNRHLLERVKGAKCAVNGVSFENLDPYVYANC